jgi:hypothetical protein
MKSMKGAGLYASHDGFHFPDGSVMTTAAETSIGMKSETDLNFIAGDNSTTDDFSASIIMTVGEKERMRVRRDGIFFRSQVRQGVLLSMGFYRFTTKSIFIRLTPIPH